ncbi:MAG: hypothetical protein ACYDH9_24515 [Limisphaerales bacterium]
MNDKLSFEARTMSKTPISLTSGAKKLALRVTRTQILGLLAFVFLTACVRSDPLDIWIRRNPLPTSSFKSVAFGNGLYVVVGDGGLLFISSDASYWATVGTGTSNRLNAVTYGGGHFIAVGDNGTIISSTNGYSWEIQSTTSSANLRGVAVLRNTFVAVGDTGTLAVSSDGKAWVNHTVSTNVTLYAAIGGVDSFVAVGGQGTTAPSVILSSPDGISWQPEDAGATNSLRAVCRSDGQYVAVGNSGLVVTSVDGTNWVQTSSGTIQNLLGVTGSNGLFVAVGSPAGSGQPTLLSSTNGAVWVSRTPNAQRILHAVTYGSGHFIAVGDLGTILVSGDGTNWVNRTSTMTGVGSSNPTEIAGLTYGNNRYVAVGGVDSSPSSIWTSIDGADWTPQIPDLLYDETLLAVTYGAGRFVAVGEGGTVYASTDGVQWKYHGLGGLSAPYFNAMTFGQNQFVAVGDYSIYTSPDGVAWTSQDSAGAGHLYSITYGNGLFLAGNSGNYNNGTARFSTSPDGVTWDLHVFQAVPTGYCVGIESVAYGNGVFSAVVLRDPSASDLWVSQDALNWTKVFTATNVYVSAVSFGASNFVAVGWIRDPNTGQDYAGCAVLNSPDGTNWIARTCGLENEPNSGLFAVTYGNGSFVAAGGLYIIQSGLFSTYAPVTNPVLSTGGFGFAVNGLVGEVYQIEATGDLSTSGWHGLGLLTNWVSPMPFSDTNVGGFPARFYRAVSP